MQCSTCHDMGWVVMINTWNSKEFVAKCSCRPHKNCKPYIEFINFNPQKYMILEEYEEQFRQGILPIKDNALAEIIAGIMVKVEKNNRETVPF